MEKLSTKAEKLKYFGFASSDVVTLRRQYSILARLKDANDSVGIVEAADSVGFLDNIIHVIDNMSSHPDESIENEKVFKFFNLVKKHKSKKIDRWVSFYLFSVPEEITLFAESFDSSKFKVVINMDLKLFAKDAVKLSDDFLNRCNTIVVKTEMGEIGVYSSEP